MAHAVMDERARRKWGEVIVHHGTLPDVWRYACEVAGPEHVKQYDEALRQDRHLPYGQRAEQGASSHYPEVELLREALGSDVAVYHLRGGNHKVTAFGFHGSGDTWTVAIVYLRQG